MIMINILLYIITSFSSGI